MKSILIICNTYYQLITAIRLTTTLWSNDKVDLIITDHSKNTNMIAPKLETEHIFNDVIWFATKELDQPACNRLSKLKKFLIVLKGMSRIPQMSQLFYDELVYYNSDVFVHGVFVTLNKVNAELVCSRYEEGILSYQDSVYFHGTPLDYANKIRKAFDKKILEYQTKNFYCFYPEMYEGNLNAIPVPIFDDFQLIGNCLSRVFNVDPEMLKIQEKYIFFTSVYDFEGGKPIGEFDLVSRISELVGKDNLLIKLHPRDSRNIYTERGFHVYEHSSIPWEAIQLNNDFSQKCFLTVNSGSILGVNLMIKNRARSYFLYNCCNLSGNVGAIASKREIERLMSNSHYDHERIMVIESSERLKDIVGKVNEQ